FPAEGPCSDPAPGRTRAGRDRATRRLPRHHPRPSDRRVRGGPDGPGRRGFRSYRGPGARADHPAATPARRPATGRTGGTRNRACAAGAAVTERYGDATALRRALEARLKQQATNTGTD